MDAPMYLQTAAEAGNRSEIIVKAILRRDGYVIGGEQNEVEMLVGNTALIRGHMDATHCVSPTDGIDRILEVKSMSETVWRKWQTYGWELFPSYSAQITFYMAAEAQRRGRPVEALYVVYNRSDGNLDIRIIQEPPVDMGELKNKVLVAESMALLGILPMCDGDPEYFCPYDYICDRNELSFEELEAGSETVMVELAERYGQVVEAMAELETQKNQVRGEIVTAMGTRKKVQIPGWSFSMTQPKPKRELDLAKVRALMGDKLDECWVEKKAGDPYLNVRQKSS